MTSTSPGVEKKSHGVDNQVTVLVDSRASGNFFDGQTIPQLNYRLLDRVSLTVLRKILAAGESLLDGTMDGLL